MTRSLSRAERIVAKEQARYAKTRSRIAYVRMRDAVTRALALSRAPLPKENGRTA